MTLRTTLAVCALISGMAAGSAFAATPLAAGAMSKADMDKTAACKKMTVDAMHKDATCMDMMKMHPDAFKATSGMAPKGNMAPKANMAPKKPS